MPPRLPAILVGLLFAAGHARAQAAVEATIDAGASRVGFAEGGTVTAFSLAPAARWTGRVLELRGAGSVSRFNAGGWSAQGAAAMSLFTPAPVASAGALRGELSATAGGNAQGDGTGGGQALLVGRAHAQGSAAGAWLGGGGGRAWEAGRARGMLVSEVGVWGGRGDVDALAVATPTHLGDSAWYTDAIATATWTRGRLALDAYAGARVAHRRATSAGWAGAGATYALVPRVALVVGAGSYPVDPTQGFPGGRYVSAAVRTSLGPRRLTGAVADPPLATAGASGNPTAARGAPPEKQPNAAPSPDRQRDTSAPDAPSAPAGPLHAFELRTAPDGRRLLRVQAAGASAVELAGDFTDWEPVPLARAADGWWEARFPIVNGVHQLNVRVDGGEWLVPPGLRRRDDGLGGVVGVLLVR